MTKIDITNWREFKVGDLFVCETTNSIPSKWDLNDWALPYITRSAENNWLSWFCWNSEKLNKWHCITIWAEWFTAFYQKDDFVAWNKVYTLRHNKLTKHNSFFIVSCLNTLSSNYSFNNARILDKIKEEHIKLPITSTWDPDREYMENYMKNIEIKVKQQIQKLKEEREIK